MQQLNLPSKICNARALSDRLSLNFEQWPAINLRLQSDDGLRRSGHSDFHVKDDFTLEDRLVLKS
jgi:hypothetical protein